MEVEGNSIPTYGGLVFENVTNGHVQDDIESFSFGTNNEKNPLIRDLSLV